MTDSRTGNLYILLISVHGLIRSRDLELGRDADTGGQTRYVVELARALAHHPDVWRVDLLTRQVVDPKVSPDYAERLEPLDDRAFIVRLPCGPRRYLRKEVLWPYLDGFTDHALQHVRRIGRVPDIVHSHYADAGYVGSRLASLLGILQVHTGHSLGRVKQQRLLEQGMREETIETNFNISQRIEAEELALDNASLVVASTQQEVKEQYSRYENYQPKRMVVIPPGVDLRHFRPPRPGEPRAHIHHQLDRFLAKPKLPMILALSRADERKNIRTLIRAYGESSSLRETANLVIVAGNRDDIQAMERGPRSVLTEALLLIDRYDLYGSVALPKHHESTDVPDLYRLAAKTRGVFVNPALTEPFGLTMIEAAASGLPVVSTRDGGPTDIIGHCKNGLLIDPLDPDAMGAALLRVLGDHTQWRRWSKAGIAGAHRHYTWQSHVDQYLQAIHRIWRGKRREQRFADRKSRLPTVDRIVVTDIDDTLVGDGEGLRQLMNRLGRAGANVGFGVATGRSLESAKIALAKWDIPTPDLLITSVGAELHYGHRMVADHAWEQHIAHRWDQNALRQAMREVPGLKLQPKANQHPYKISYFVNEQKAPGVREIVRRLRKLDLHANVIQSHGMFLDLLPIRASKGLALRYIYLRWGLDPDRFLVAGGSGNDEGMLRGNTLGVVVGNYSKELQRLKGKPRIFFASRPHAWGILEGIDYYDFLGEIHVPDEEAVES